MSAADSTSASGELGGATRVVDTGLATSAGSVEQPAAPTSSSAMPARNTADTKAVMAKAGENPTG